MNSARPAADSCQLRAPATCRRHCDLVASLLASSPAWRHVDPLPVLGRDDEEEGESDEAEETEQDHKDDGHRAAWVLEERESLFLSRFERTELTAHSSEARRFSPANSAHQAG